MSEAIKNTPMQALRNSIAEMIETTFTDTESAAARAIVYQIDKNLLRLERDFAQDIFEQGSDHAQHPYKYYDFEQYYSLFNQTTKK